MWLFVDAAAAKVSHMSAPFRSLFLFSLLLLPVNRMRVSFNIRNAAETSYEEEEEEINGFEWKPNIEAK